MVEAETIRVDVGRRVVTIDPRDERALRQLGRSLIDQADDLAGGRPPARGEDLARELMARLAERIGPIDVV